MQASKAPIFCSSEPRVCGLPPTSVLLSLSFKWKYYQISITMSSLTCLIPKYLGISHLVFST